MRHAEFNDPRLVEVYDAECVWGPEDDWFLAVANEVPGARVLDLGCGTGRVTLALAAAGHTVTGVDPAAASLAAARAKRGAERVTWVHGTSRDLPESAFDTAVMTAHVAQFFVSDDDFAGLLHDLARALVPGGRLAFDHRDVAARKWEDWHGWRRRIVLGDGRVVDCATEVTDVSPDAAVDFTHHYAFPDGTVLDSTATLRFRTERQVRDALAAAGFAVDAVYGGWRGEPVGGSPDGELLPVARRRVDSIAW